MKQTKYLFDENKMTPEGMGKGRAIKASQTRRKKK